MAVKAVADVLVAQGAQGGGAARDTGHFLAPFVQRHFASVNAYYRP